VHAWAIFCPIADSLRRLAGQAGCESVRGGGQGRGVSKSSTKRGGCKAEFGTHRRKRRCCSSASQSSEYKAPAVPENGAQQGTAGAILLDVTIGDVSWMCAEFRASRAEQWVEAKQHFSKNS
jgi:hypothetical protein